VTGGNEPFDHMRDRQQRQARVPYRVHNNMKPHAVASGLYLSESEETSWFKTRNRA
jgi:hypothetical protein